VNKSRRILTTLTLLASLLTSVAAQSPPTVQQTVLTPQGLEYVTLEYATEQFLQKNLTVEAARLEIGVAEAERVGARLRPRPGLTVSAENLRISGPTATGQLYEFGATVAQPIELGNRKEARVELAERTVAVSEARLTEVLRLQLFNLKRTYYESVLARAVLDLEKENRDNFEGLLRFNRTRFEEGYIAEGDLIKVRLERVKFDFEVASAALDFTKAKIRLLELIGDSDFQRAEKIDVRSSFGIPDVKIDLAQLKQTALANRPEIKVAEAEVARTESSLKLERSKAKGEITPYGGYKRVGVDNTVAAGVTVPLPFGNRNQSGIARAEAEQKIAQTSLAFARNRTLADVETAFQGYETAREQIRAYQDGLLKQADESRDIQLAAYQEGVVELITLIDAQRTRTEVRANYYRALFDFYTSIFQLELATGVDIKL
jgi:outer membrane protein, heavy metal efflux system